MATFNKHNVYVNDVMSKVHNMASDTLKNLLTDTLPTASNAVLADLTDIGAGNGYTAGGTQAVQTSSSQTGGTYKLVVADVVFTASGGTIGAFRYTDLYNSTPSSPLKPLIGWYDYGSSITLNSGETFTVDYDGTNGVLTLA